MNWIQKSSLIVVVVIAVVAGMVIGTNVNTPVAAQGAATAMGRYSVVSTEGVNLIVTDNQKNVVLFYTVDEGERPGADLHLRGTLDLTTVGNATLKPTLINPRKHKE